MSNWNPCMQGSHFAIEIWKSYFDEYEIALRQDYPSPRAKIIATYKPGDEDYESVKQGWLEQYKKIHGKDYNNGISKYWWEFWK